MSNTTVVVSAYQFFNKYFDRIYTNENILLENIIQIIDNS